MLKANILLLEPNDILAKTYKTALDRAGYNVIQTNNVESAIGLLDQNKIDLVLMEVQIAGHNGLEFLYEMRTYPEWDGIKVVINSLVDLKKLNSITLNQCNISQILYKPKTKLIDIISTVNNALNVITK